MSADQTPASESFGGLRVEDRKRSGVVTPPKCQCPDPDHRCTNDAADHGVDVSPALCVPCLYGCMP